MQPFQALQEKLDVLSSPLAECFGSRLKTAIENFLQKQSLLPFSSQQETSEQKAFVHALQLYDVASLRKLMANYEVAQTSQGARRAVEKSIHSLKVIPHLEPLAVTPMEKAALFSYTRQLQAHLAFALSCPMKELVDSQKLAEWLQQFSEKLEADRPFAQSFVTQRLDLLFSAEYQIYLRIKNRYFLHYLGQTSADYPIEKWLQTLLDEIHVPLQKDLPTRLASLNFRTTEYLVQRMLHQQKPNDPMPEFSPALLQAMLEEKIVLENETHCNLPSPHVLQRLSDLETIPTAPPLAQESQGELPLVSALAPRQPLQRSPFERLCLQYIKELLYLSNHTEWVTECSSPYFRSKGEDYVSAHRAFFAHFFAPHERILEEFSQFAGAFLEKTQRANGFKSQQEQIGIYVWRDGEWQVANMQERVKEWSVLLKSQLPFALTMTDDHEKRVVAKGWPFIIQLGRTYFDYDRPKHEWSHTPPTGYFKILLKGSQLLTNSAVIYAGNHPYYRLTDSQLKQWRGLILLYFIVIRNKYSVELSAPLADYLTQTLPLLMEPNL